MSALEPTLDDAAEAEVLVDRAEVRERRRGPRVLAHGEAHDASVVGAGALLPALHVHQQQLGPVVVLVLHHEPAQCVCSKTRALNDKKRARGGNEITIERDSLKEMKVESYCASCVELSSSASDLISFQREIKRRR